MDSTGTTIFFAVLYLPMCLSLTESKLCFVVRVSKHHLLVGSQSVYIFYGIHQSSAKERRKPELIMLNSMVSLVFGFQLSSQGMVTMMISIFGHALCL